MHITSQEKQQDACHTDNSSDNFGQRDFLLEKVPTGQQDEDGSHGHDGLRYTRMGVKRRHKGKTDSEEGAHDGGNEGEGHATAVADSGDHPTSFARKKHDKGKSQEPSDGTDEGAGKGHHLQYLRSGDECFVMCHANFAKYKSYTLSKSSADTEENAFQRKF